MKPHSMELPVLDQSWFKTTAGLLAFLGSLWVAVPRVWKAFKTIHSVAGKIDKLCSEEEGGGTMMLKKINDSVVEIKDTQNRQEQRQVRNEGRVRALFMDTNEMIFESDKDGKCVHVNRTYARNVGMSASECLGYGWLNAVADEDRDAVVRAWEHAIKDKREFIMNYRMMCVEDGKIFRVRCSALPTLCDKGDLFGYIGKLTIFPATSPSI